MSRPAAFEPIAPLALCAVRGAARIPMTREIFEAGLARADQKSLLKFWTWLRPTRREMAHRRTHSWPDIAKTYLYP